MRLTCKVTAILIFTSLPTSEKGFTNRYRGTRRLQTGKCQILRQNMNIFGHQSETQKLSLLLTLFHIPVPASL